MMERTTGLSLDDAQRNAALYLKDYYQLSDELVDKIWNLCTLRHYNKNDLIITEGSKVNTLLLLLKGICASFYYKEDGQESICNFRKEGEFFDLPHTLFADEKSLVSVKAMAKTTLLCIEHKYYHTLNQEYAEFNLLTQKISEESAVDKELHYYFIRRYSALERINISLKDPRINEIKKHVPDYAIASYLNIAPETYSSLQKKAPKEKKVIP